jgi:transposase-like protein
MVRTASVEKPSGSARRIATSPTARATRRISWARTVWLSGFAALAWAQSGGDLRGLTAGLTGLQGAIGDVEQHHRGEHRRGADGALEAGQPGGKAAQVPARLRRRCPAADFAGRALPRPLRRRQPRRAPLALGLRRQHRGDVEQHHRGEHRRGADGALEAGQPGGKAAQQQTLRVEPSRAPYAVASLAALLWLSGFAALAWARATRRISWARTASIAAM